MVAALKFFNTDPSTGEDSDEEGSSSDDVSLLLNSFYVLSALMKFMITE